MLLGNALVEQHGPIADLKKYMTRWQAAVHQLKKGLQLNEAETQFIERYRKYVGGAFPAAMTCSELSSDSYAQYYAVMQALNLYVRTCTADLTCRAKMAIACKITSSKGGFCDVLLREPSTRRRRSLRSSEEELFTVPGSRARKADDLNELYRLLNLLDKLHRTNCSKAK